MREEMIRTLDRVVADTLPVAEREHADGGGISDKLWAALTEQGITALGETGSEIGFADTMALVQRSAYHAVPIPLAETVLVRRLVSKAGLTPPDGAMTIAPPRPGTGSAGVAAAVPFGRHVPHLLAVSGDALTLYDAASAVTHRAHNQAGEARDTVDLGKARRVAGGTLAGGERRAQLEGALIRAVQLSGALERALEHSLTWANERVQFGRPIARFQAIQHNLAVMASEVAAARAAVERAVEASEEAADWFSVAVAKSRTGEAAGKVANAAHAAFGAMGFTREHQLHYATRRLWAWRDDFGSEVAWQTELGRYVAAKGGRGLWAAIAENG